jgi:hypothetical protein
VINTLTSVPNILGILGEYDLTTALVRPRMHYLAPDFQRIISALSLGNELPKDESFVTTTASAPSAHARARSRSSQGCAIPTPHVTDTRAITS